MTIIFKNQSAFIQNLLSQVIAFYDSVKKLLFDVFWFADGDSLEKRRRSSSSMSGLSYLAVERCIISNNVGAESTSILYTVDEHDTDKSKYPNLLSVRESKSP